MIEEFNAFLTEYIEIQSQLLSYIQANCDTVNFTNFTQIISENEITNSEAKIIPFLLILSQVSGSHYRNSGFLEKINQILLFISPSITTQLQNIDELFNIFKYNKTILLLILKHIDQFCREANAKNDFLYRIFGSDDEDLFQYFYPELRDLCQNNQNDAKSLNINEFNNKVEEYSISKFIKTNDENIELFNQNRILGENETEISIIIRSDNIDQFIEKKPAMNHKISSSPFESNEYLLDHSPTLIEYAAFMGSLSIFSYLLDNMKPSDINPKILSYAVHGLNIDIIHKLETFFNLTNRENVQKYLPNLKDCFLEAIKSHHNDIAEYIQSTYLSNVQLKYAEASINSYNDLYLKKAIDASNNTLITDPKEAQNLFNYFCANGYMNIVDFLLHQSSLININGKDAIRMNNIFFE